jgi:hypothetical protein
MANPEDGIRMLTQGDVKAVVLTLGIDQETIKARTP